MKQVNLSFVMTTFNKLPYLKEVIKLLLVSKRPDEEIVITDGGSTDGTVEFLTLLYKEGKIDQFISEKDYGEAHGFNRAILMAKGALIKILSDDDVYSYPAIAKCRSFMELNTEFDALVGNSGTASTNFKEEIILNPEMQNEFSKWASGINKAFYCNGLSLMIRRSSLPLLGLFNLSFICVDLEFTIRTSGIANYAFATDYIVIRVVNSSSNGNKYADQCRKEQMELCRMYEYPVPQTWLPSGEKDSYQSIWWKVKNRVNVAIIKLKNKQPVEIEPPPVHAEYSMANPDLYNYYLDQLNKLNEKNAGSFLKKITPEQAE